MNIVKSTRIVVCLDVSGSMERLLPKAIASFNDTVKSIKKSAEARGQDATLSLVTFNKSVTTHFFNRGIAAVESRPLSQGDLKANGQTALYDAVAYGIDHMTKAPVGIDEDVAYILIAITDGAENASSIRKSALVDKIRAAEETDRWTISFVVPNGDEQSILRDLGLHAGNITGWDQSERGVETYSQSLNASFDNYFEARDRGLRSVATFFKSDMTHVRAADVKSAEDVTLRTRVIPVLSQQDIRSFCLDQVGSFKIGHAFYELTKAENVQDHKGIIIQNKRTGKRFGGPKVRDLLGLPNFGSVKVHPGNHGEWDVFVQSTSTNRKLVPGTRVVYAA